MYHNRGQDQTGDVSRFFQLSDGLKNEYYFWTSVPYFLFQILLPSSLDPGEGFQWEIVMKNYAKNEYFKKGFGRRNKKTDIIL